MPGHTMKRNHKRKSRKSRKARKTRKGGSVMGALKTALLPFLYKHKSANRKRLLRKVVAERSAAP